ncbi:MAG: hypothetical protein JRJ84_16515, partial [Deltaproteobacteria bacterium]|nr:hypothetical protein [Deltaproteobacteria bacterium]
LLDSYTFPTNPGNGFSIEKKALLGGDVEDNWEASTCGSGSSPGEPGC